MDLANWALRTSQLNSPQGLNISSIKVFDQIRDQEIPIYNECVRVRACMVCVCVHVLCVCVCVCVCVSDTLSNLGTEYKI